MNHWSIIENWNIKWSHCTTVRDSAQSQPQQSPDHNLLNTDHPHLQPSFSTPSKTRFTQTLVVQATAHHPNSSQIQCAFTCVYLPSQTPGNLIAILQRSYCIVHGSRTPPVLQWQIHFSIQLRLSGLFLSPKFSPSICSSQPDPHSCQ